MIFNKNLILNVILALIVQMDVYSVTKEERLSGLIIKKDSPKFDAFTWENGFHNCNIATDGELFVIGMIRPDDFLADVGANVGDWSALAFDFQPTISACCFEPIPMLQPLLKKHLAGRNVIFSELALSNTVGKTVFFYYPNQPHLSSLHRRSDENLHHIAPTPILVQLGRLDTFYEQHHISKANIVKIDVEGEEYHVLQGAKGLLDKQAIDVIQFEYDATYLSSNSTLRQVYDYLTAYDFTIYRLTPWGLIEIPAWRQELENFQFCNYVALRNAKNNK